MSPFVTLVVVINTVPITVIFFIVIIVIVAFIAVVTLLAAFAIIVVFFFVVVVIKVIALLIIITINHIVPAGLISQEGDNIWNNYGNHHDRISMALHPHFGGERAIDLGNF